MHSLLARLKERALGFFIGFIRGRWAVPLVAIMAALDAFLLVIPNDALLIAAVLAQPKRWIRITLWITIGSTVGAVIFAGLVSHFGEEMLRHFMPSLMESQHWLDFANLVHRHGLWGLTLVSLGPLPQQTGVAIAGLSNMPLHQVAIGVFLGRFVKYLLIAWCAVHAPNVLRRLKILPKAN
jgi:membrane protein YqaA with SNARE-associated domain